MNICLDYIDPEEKETLSTYVNKSYEIKTQLHCNCVTNATILPIKRNNWQYLGGVMLQDGTMVASSGCFDYSDGNYGFEDYIVSAETVIYVGCFQSVWGHILTDNIKKLWFLNTEECRQLIQDGAKVCYTTIQGEPIGNSVWNLLDLLGFSKELFVEIENATFFKRVYVPDNQFVSFEGLRYFHPEFIDLYQEIKKKVAYKLKEKTKYFEKVYFTRTKSTRYWREMGEHYFEKIFNDLGFQIIAPETLPLETQIWLLMNCKEFATTEGSISHNAIFCSPGTRVIIIRKSKIINEYQLPINEMAQLNVVYIDAHHSTNLNPAVPVAGPFYMCINNNIERFIGKRIIHRPYWLHFSWIMYINRHRFQRWFQTLKKYSILVNKETK